MYISVLVRHTDEKESWLNEINIYFSTGFYDFPPALREKHGGIIWLFRLKLLVSQGWLFLFSSYRWKSHFSHSLFLQIRSRLRRKLHSIFPLVDNGTSISRSSHENETATGNISRKTKAKHSVVTERRNDSSEKTSCL